MLGTWASSYLILQYPCETGIIPNHFFTDKKTKAGSDQVICPTYSASNSNTDMSVKALLFLSH